MIQAGRADAPSEASYNTIQAKKQSMRKANPATALRKVDNKKNNSELIFYPEKRQQADQLTTVSMASSKQSQILAHYQNFKKIKKMQDDYSQKNGGRMDSGMKQKKVVRLATENEKNRNIFTAD